MTNTAPAPSCPAAAEFLEQKRRFACAMKDLMGRMMLMEDKQQADPTNWGYAGSLGHITDTITELAESLPEA